MPVTRNGRLRCSGSCCSTASEFGEQHSHTGWARYRFALSERDAGRTDQALEQMAIVHTTWINRFGCCPSFVMSMTASFRMRTKVGRIGQRLLWLVFIMARSCAW